jgi:hypothetical protein
LLDPLDLSWIDPEFCLLKVKQILALR